MLSQPDGVGLLTALVYLLTLEDKNRFKNSRMAGAIGSTEEGPVRKDRQTASHHEGRGPLPAASAGGLRQLHPRAIREGERSTALGTPMASRGGKNAMKRAKVAVARKLAVLMHRLWVTGEPYQPVGYSKPLAA